MDTLTIAEREPDAYDKSAKCPHCSRAMFQWPDAAPRCPYQRCPGYAETHPEPTDG